MKFWFALNEKVSQRLMLTLIDTGESGLLG